MCPLVGASVINIHCLTQIPSPGPNLPCLPHRVWKRVWRILRKVRPSWARTSGQHKVNWILYDKHKGWELKDTLEISLFPLHFIVRETVLEKKGQLTHLVNDRARSRGQVCDFQSTAFIYQILNSNYVLANHRDCLVIFLTYWRGNQDIHRRPTCPKLLATPSTSLPLQDSQTLRNMQLLLDFCQWKITQFYIFTPKLVIGRG